MVIRRQEEPERTERPKGQSRPHREKMRVYTIRLNNWMERRSGLQEVLTFNEALDGKHISYFTKWRA